jgi:hypothetical protein
MRRTAALGSLILLLGGAAACGGGEELLIEATPAAMKAAGEATVQAGSARTEMVMRIDLSAMGLTEPVEITVQGVQDFEAQRSSMTMDMGAMLQAIAGQSGQELPPGLDGDMTTVQDGDDMYMCGGFLALLGGPECLHMNFQEITGADLQSLSGGAGADPMALLASLAGVDGVEEVGREEAVGVQTTHFAGTITMRDSIANANPEQTEGLETLLESRGLGDDFLDTPLDVDLWIDDEGRVRQMHQRVDELSVGGVTTAYDIELRFLEFGVPVEIEIPEDFVDASDLPGFGG